ncbi:MAG: hypothetical protein COT84_06660 [Chlamydiae bacterium CG10_big_fil_rev_8_21_14_0_10_35_9]|nr:MAG: hypothetical protein COT84_06660 [Chlamydiae bacterium CG10_big_fil_rev_8_21_14_0_10_35_9]
MEIFLKAILLDNQLHSFLKGRIQFKKNTLMPDSFDLALDIGNSTLGGAFFQEELLIETFHLPVHPLKEKDLDPYIQNKSISQVIIGSDNIAAGLTCLRYFQAKNIPVFEVDSENLSLILDVEKPSEVGNDRIANSYGGLFAHPNTDLIIVDMGTALAFDVVARERRFLGGAIAPGLHIAAKALSEFTDKLPLVEIEKPKSCLSKSTIGNIQSGVYYGMIGTIEKIVSEIKNIHFGQGNVLVIATGSLANPAEAEADSSIFAKLRSDLEKDLKTTIDYFEPDLTFFGLHEILKEKANGKRT